MAVVVRPTAFAIRICRRLTSRFASFQSMDFHSAARLTDAPSCSDDLCFPVFNVLPDPLATEHLPDVGTRLAPPVRRRFRVRPVSAPIPGITPEHSLLPDSYTRDSNGTPYGDACPWRGEGAGFPRSALLTIMERLRPALLRRRSHVSVRAVRAPATCPPTFWSQPISTL